jgi:hypothetical protein
MKLLKLGKNLGNEISNQFKKNKILSLSILLLVILILGVLYYTNRKSINENNSNALNLNAINIENFDSSNSNQNGNVIYNFKGNDTDIQNNPTISTSNTDNGLENEDRVDFKLYTIELDKLYKLTDIYVDIGATPDVSKSIKIGVFNNANSDLSYVDLTQHSDDLEEKITKQITSSETINNMKDLNNNDIYGNQVMIYISDNNNMLGEMSDNGSGQSDENNKITFTICGIHNDENIHENEMEYLVDKSIDITGSQENGKLEVEEIKTFEPADSSKNLYKVTYIEFSNNNLNELFDIVYTNPYTEEVMTYKSDRSDGKFIVTSAFNKILIYDKVLLANSIKLGNTKNITGAIFKGYKATVNDINQFKLENNLTDIRGSINPSDVCPSLDNLIQGQLNAETIIDAMDNQEKIKDEKIKLQSRKEALLTLLEQKEDISRLGNMLDSIDTITKKRNMDTDALNAIKFTKQMDEVSKLKEVLDARIKYNEDNTINIDKVNLNIYRDPTEEELQLYNLPNVVDAGGSGSGTSSTTTVVDEFVDMGPKLPIDEEMRM